MRRNLRNIFHRIGMSEQDVRTLRGAVVRLVAGAARGAGAAEPTVARKQQRDAQRRKAADRALPSAAIGRKLSDVAPRRRMPFLGVSSLDFGPPSGRSFFVLAAVRRGTAKSRHPWRPL